MFEVEIDVRDRSDSIRANPCPRHSKNHVIMESVTLVLDIPPAFRLPPDAEYSDDSVLEAYFSAPTAADAAVVDAAAVDAAAVDAMAADAAPADAAVVDAAAVDAAAVDAAASPRHAIRHLTLRFEPSKPSARTSSVQGPPGTRYFDPADKRYDLSQTSVSGVKALAILVRVALTRLPQLESLRFQDFWPLEAADALQGMGGVAAGRQQRGHYLAPCRVEQQGPRHDAVQEDFDFSAMPPCSPSVRFIDLDFQGFASVGSFPFELLASSVFAGVERIEARSRAGFMENFRGRIVCGYLVERNDDVEQVGGVAATSQECIPNLFFD